MMFTLNQSSMNTAECVLENMIFNLIRFTPHNNDYTS